jgi:hypothetical protein
MRNGGNARKATYEANQRHADIEAEQSSSKKAQKDRSRNRERLQKDIHEGEAAQDGEVILVLVLGHYCAKLANISDALW